MAEEAQSGKAQSGEDQSGSSGQADVAAEDANLDAAEKTAVGVAESLVGGPGGEPPTGGQDPQPGISK